jgi:hypothetical protein
MRTLSAELLAELNLTLTRPGYLVSVAFSVPLYLSTLGDIVYDGKLWVGADVKVSGLAKNERGDASGSLSLGNAMLDYGALALNEGVADRAIRIWSVWAGAVEPVEEFNGVGDACEVGDRVTISLAGQGSRALYSPRRFINGSTGFTTLLPAGAKVTIGQQTYVLERS